jgi:hypothetical protein
MKGFIFLAIIALLSVAFSPPDHSPGLPKHEFEKHEFKKIKLAKVAEAAPISIVAAPVLDVIVLNEYATAIQQHEAELTYHLKNAAKHKDIIGSYAVIRRDLPPIGRVKNFKDCPKLE